jgi:hypothetical protein
LYEDDGATEAYQQGQYEWTEIKTRVEGENTWEVYVAPVQGRCDALPDRRGYEIRLEGSRQPQEVTLDGRETRDWTYDPNSLSTTIHVPARDKRQPVAVVAVAETEISALGEAHNRTVILSDVRRLLGDRCPEGIEEADTSLNAVLDLSPDTPGRADAIARLGGPFVRVIEFVTPEETSQQLGRVLLGRIIIGAPARKDEPYDLETTFTLRRMGKKEQHTIQIQSATASQILDTPFTFDGRVWTIRWEAEIKITWKGRTLIYTHQSKPGSLMMRKAMAHLRIAWSFLTHCRQTARQFLRSYLHRP